MKKFLTVLLALSVVFTYTVGSAFAGTPSTTKQESLEAFGKVVEEAQKEIAYDGYGYMKTDDFVNGILSKTVVEKGIVSLEDKYLKAIDNASGNWDTTWSAVKDANSFLNELFSYSKLDTYTKKGEALSAGSEYKDANTLYVLHNVTQQEDITSPQTYPDEATFTAAWVAAGNAPAISAYEVEWDYARQYTTLISAQYDIDKAAAKEALDPDLKGYTDEAVKSIQAAIKTQTTAYNAALKKTDKVEAIKAFRDVVDKMAEALKDQPTDETAAKELAEAKKDVAKALDEKSADFIEAVKKATAATASQVALQKTVVSDVADMVNFFEAKVDSILASDETDTKKIELLKGTAGVEDVINTTFATTGSVFSSEFYNDLKVLDTVELLKIYAEDAAAEKKLERKSDGTLRYAAKDVEKAYDDAITAIAAGAYNDIDDAITTVTIDKGIVDTIMANIIEQEYPLQSYKESKIDYITGTKVTGGNTDTTYDSSNWEKGERRDKVVAIQEKASEDILLAESVADVDAVVKKAVADMDAILTANQILALEKTTDTRINALGYGNVFTNYYNAVVGTKDYSLKTRTDAINNAKQVLKDAVIAAENADISRSEIDKIIKDNYDKAIAALVDVKTDAQLAEEAKAVDALIAALPKTVELTDKEQVLAAQKAYDAYLDLPGTNTIDVKNRYTLDTAMDDLMYLEAKAVRDQIRALPDTITVGDAAAIEAARAAYDALDTVYGDYGIVLPAATALEAAEIALENARVKDAADKIAALGADPTIAEVEAARAAYDLLTTKSKLKFNEELFADLLKAEAAAKQAVIATVESLKIKVSTKLYTKSNKIRVNWKVVDGDASAADGYYVYKSTKAQTGYKYMGKTTKNYMDNKKNLTKGKRYFYKVKAYVEIDGVKYFSDDSNKGNRIYK